MHFNSTFHFDSGSRHVFSQEYQVLLLEANNLFAGVPSYNVAVGIDIFIRDLKSTRSFWDRLKRGHILHAGSALFGTIDIKDPGGFKNTLVNGPAFLDGNGIKSNGTSSYIVQEFKSDEYSGIESDLTALQYISESSMEVVYRVSAGFRVSSAGERYVIAPNAGGGSAGDRRQYSFGLSFINANHKGLYLITYDGVNSVVYKDGVKSANPITPVLPDISVNRCLLALNNSSSSGGVGPVQFYDKYLALDLLFDRFDDADELAFRNIFNKYKSNVGLP